MPIGIKPACSISKSVDRTTNSGRAVVKDMGIDHRALDVMVANVSPSQVQKFYWDLPKPFEKDLEYTGLIVKGRKQLYLERSQGSLNMDLYATFPLERGIGSKRQSGLGVTATEKI